MFISGRFRYATKLYVDYLTLRMPNVLVCTKIPSDAQRRGRPLVTISSLPAGSHRSAQLAWRRLVFGCVSDDEQQGAELCERVRAEVIASRYAHVVRATRIVGEPGRFDLDDEPVPRFQVTIDVLQRENYRHLTVVR